MIYNITPVLYAGDYISGGNISRNKQRMRSKAAAKGR